MTGIEPALSMMYFYVETYTKVFIPQALATELHPQKKNLLPFTSFRFNSINLKTLNKTSCNLLRKHDSNMRPPVYETGELPTAPYRDLKK